MTPATPPKKPAKSDTPTTSTDSSKLRAIVVANRAMHAKEEDVLKAQAALKEARNAYADACSNFREIVDNAPQGELFAEKAGG